MMRRTIWVRRRPVQPSRGGFSGARPPPGPHQGGRKLPGLLLARVMQVKQLQSRLAYQGVAQMNTGSRSLMTSVMSLLVVAIAIVLAMLPSLSASGG